MLSFDTQSREQTLGLLGGRVGTERPAQTSAVLRLGADRSDYLAQVRVWR